MILMPKLHHQSTCLFVFAWAFVLACSSPDATTSSATNLGKSDQLVGDAKDSTFEDAVVSDLSDTLTVELIAPESCTNPCSFAAKVVGSSIASVQYDADGWVFAAGYAPDFEVEYLFSELGQRLIVATALDVSGQPLTSDSQWVEVLKPELECGVYDSDVEDFAPIQITGTGVASGALVMEWMQPTDWVYIAYFWGSPGSPAGHEGDDYVHDDQSVERVDVRAAAGGTVVYVRTGCPQSSMFAHNTALRECGSGWGNHVIVDHGNQLYTRYGHLAPTTEPSVKVGDEVEAGSLLGEMGNTGRSELRHLHFELATRVQSIDPCEGSQSFDFVYPPKDYLP